MSVCLYAIMSVCLYWQIQSHKFFGGSGPDNEEMKVSSKKIFL